MLRRVGSGLSVLLVIAACGSDAPDDDGGDDGAFGNGADAGSGKETRDPVNCEEAKTTMSYVGCDYWPTITPNIVASSFAFTVVVANTGAAEAKVTVTGPNAVDQQVTVASGALAKIELPWVPELKGGDSQKFELPPSPATVVVPKGAYHLVASRPVIVYQFNPLAFEAKDKGACSGDVECLNSYSNDASLLLPSTAMRNSYRVTGISGSVTFASVVSVTATAPQTSVTVHLSKSAKVKASVAGAAIPETNAGGKLQFTLANAGDVAQLVTPDDSSVDLSGSLVASDKPVQVITSVPCTFVPADVGTCDHVEETVLPAEALGKKYVISTPTSFEGKSTVHVVRLYGNEDGTKLTYAPAKPSKCPSEIDAGEVVDCNVVDRSFVVEGSAAFGVSSFLVGSTYTGDDVTTGDPSQTTFPSVEQFRKKYVFLAPTDYPIRFADVTATEGTTLTLNGKTVDAPWEKIGDGPYGVVRVSLKGTGKDGAHVLTATNPVGVQVLGYAYATSFEYPAGFNLDLLAPPPQAPR